MGLFNKEKPGIIDTLGYAIKCGFKLDKGDYGEWLTEYALKNITGYKKIIRNIYVPYNETTSEIDIVMIHEKGIYVFESKNYSGWIFGSAEQQNWTQMLNKNSKYQFYNPLKQNYTHITALSKFLNIKRDNFKSYIIFSERCELKKVPENTESYIILKRDDILSSIQDEISRKEKILTKDEVNNINEKLKVCTNVSKKKKQEHIENINNKYKK